MSTILKVDDINVYYGSIHAIKGISFEVNEGEIVTLIGANGAGKSTTLNTISGLLHSKTGHIEFMGEPLNHVPSHKVVSKGLALVPEGRRIFLQMSVQENLDMGAFSRRGGNIDADMERVFEQFPRLKERRRQIAGTLSGGEQQMLAIGRALMCSDLIITLMACVAFGMETGLFCILGLVIKSLLVDMVLENINTHKYFHIITTKPREIEQYITNVLKRGATELHGEGAYTHEGRTVLMTVMKRHEAIMLRKYVKMVDPHAFVLIMNTGEIIGKGFRGTN